MYAPYAMANAWQNWKMIPLLSNSWNQFTVAILFTFMKQLTVLGHFFLQILVEGYSELLALPFYLVSYIPSIYYWCPLLSFNLLLTYNMCWVWVSFGNSAFLYVFFLAQYFRLSTLTSTKWNWNICKSSKFWYSSKKPEDVLQPL